MRILVTGGSGFVGTNLIKRLLKEEHQVISIDDYSTGLKSNHQFGCKYMNHDIRKLTEFPIVDVVFHLAAKARIQPSFTNPTEYITTNGNGTLNIVNWCSNNNIPLIYAGSSSKHSGRFKNPYTFSKDIGEDIVKLYEEHFKLQVSIARFYNVYGPYQLLEGGYSTLIGKWINNIQNNKPCVIYGTGEKRRDFTHIDDIVDALIKIMEQNKYGYEFELGRGKNFSVNEIAEMFNIEPIYEKDKPGEALNTLNTDTTAKNILGWKPEKNIVNYIKDLNL
jgi:UDP-glucose 4-epimerase|tara:strand:+ start:14767 stop:15600 length:834 start_codon:yes stop_codon:yes gene_type:complete